jgi:hypothetical protein
MVGKRRVGGPGSGVELLDCPFYHFRVLIPFSLLSTVDGYLAQVGRKLIVEEIIAQTLER